jgi:hypothetical protein
MYGETQGLGGGWEAEVESLGRDARYRFLQVLRSPDLSIVAILSLALGIGANTAIFTVINDLLLKQLPVRDLKCSSPSATEATAASLTHAAPGAYDVFPYESYKRIAGNRNQFDGICAFVGFN